MKFLFILILFSFQVSAADEKLCSYLKTNTLKNYSKSFNNSENSKLAKVITEVSRELDLKRDAECKTGKLWAIRDYDSCSSLCVSSGSSESRLKATIYTKGIIDLTKETRKCQELCKGYQLSAFAYEDGTKANSTSPDCRGSVNSSDRSKSKDTVFDGASEKERTFDSGAVSK
jgi:hypothetical protein